MFRQPVPLIPPFTREMKRSHPLMNEISNDNTLFMTAMALLYGRVENLKLTSSIKQTSIGGLNVSEIDNDKNFYSFYWFETSENPDIKLEEIKNKFETIIPFMNIEKFVKDKFQLNVHIRSMPKENTACFFVEKLTYEVWHLMQSFISKYFDIFKEKPLTADEIEFVRSLTLRTCTNYTNRIQALTESESFRNYSLNMMLNGFEKRLFERKLEGAQRDVNNLENELEGMMAQYREKMKKKLEAVIRLEGLRVMTDNTEERTELQEYLVRNKNLADISVEGSVIRFVVKTFLRPYHADDWDNMDKRGYIFEGWKYPKEDMKLLMNAIFSANHCLKLKICGEVELDYSYAQVSSDRAYNYSRMKDYVPNTHLQRHSCFGMNGADICELLKQGDAVSAIECSINAVKHVNINELEASFKPFILNILHCEGKCLVTDDGTEMTVTEAISFLKGKANESNTVEQ